jgi:hypothetical protein
MTKDVSKVTFDPKPLKSGTGWYVVATYPGSQQEHIPGFKTEAEAVEWLASTYASACLSQSRTMKHAELSSIDQGGGKRHGDGMARRQQISAPRS